MPLRALAAATTLVVTVALALLGAGAASAAPAHGDGGLLAVEAAHPTPTGFHYIVRLTFQADGHPVSDATVTATPVGPDGTEGEPVTLEPYDDDGRYQAAVDMPDPGSWTVRFASADPEATAEATAEVEATTTTGADEAGSGEDTGGFAPADDGTGDSASGSADADESDDGGSSSFPILIVLVAAIVAVGGLFTALRTIGRTRPGSSSPGAAATATPPDRAATDEPDGADDADGADGPDATDGASGLPSDGGAPVGGGDGSGAGDASGGDGG